MKPESLSTLDKVQLLKGRLVTYLAQLRKDGDKENYDNNGTRTDDDDDKALMAVKHCLQQLDALGEEITTNILIETNIKKVVHRFANSEKYPNHGVCDLAQEIINKWTEMDQLETIQEAQGILLDCHAILIKGMQDNPQHNEEEKDAVAAAVEALKFLDETKITSRLLNRSSIDETVAKFKKFQITRPIASALIDKWSKKTRQVTGPARMALTEFRRREAQLRQEQKAKPDMIAFKELRSKWTPTRKHGRLEGVPVGIRLNGRGEAAILGIHQKILSGIDATKDDACYAVCVAGKYDDKDDVDGSGTVIYTGSGGHDGNRQVEDQEENVDNQSLLLSISRKSPIRMLRRCGRSAKDTDYFYDGLYRCTGFTYEPSSDGPKVYRFTLEPIPGESKQSMRVHRPLAGLKRVRGVGGKLLSAKEKEINGNIRGARQRKTKIGIYILL